MPAHPSFNALGVLALTITAHCQSSNPAATPTSFDEPCAEVSASQSQFFAANPTSDVYASVPADLAYSCQQSVPLVKEDAVSLLTGLRAWWEWQSTAVWLKNPPGEWPFPAVDILGGLQELKDKVEDGTITREIDFEWELMDLVTSAKDGHFSYAPDAYSAFAYFNPLQNIVSLSVDGTQLPVVYLLGDLNEASDGTDGWEPSPISMINGTDVVAWLTDQAVNGTMNSQDPDALYNRLFWTPAGENGGTAGYFSSPPISRYIGSSLSIDFKNGSNTTSQLLASLPYLLTGVVDGESFYTAFCNTTVKASVLAAAATATATATSVPLQPTPTGAPDPEDLRPNYPLSVAISEDASLAGYFLDDLPSVAVLSIYSMSTTSQPSVQQTLTKFLNRCRETNKTHLILDISQNGGGSTGVAYDIFKQLFPSLEPYAAGQFRATPQINALGSYFTPEIQEAKAEEPGNVTFALMHGAYTTFDATIFSNNSGDQFQTWDGLFGPVQVHGDSFSQQFHFNISDPVTDIQTSSIVISGYGDNSTLAPQPFLSENIIAFGDGYCASACTTLLHMLKYQAKVKTMVAGGRPRHGPAQAMGGVKGSRVVAMRDIVPSLLQFYAEAPTSAIEQANKTMLKDFVDNWQIVSLRNIDDSAHVQVNLYNAIAEYDESLTPLHFVYEAADCRIWYQQSHLSDFPSLWQLVAVQAFGLNGTERFSLCVEGSTNHPSSLSRNQTLFQDGQIVNVTGYEPEDNGLDASSDQQNGASSFTMSMSTIGLVLLFGLTTLSFGVLF